jgi:hypothetical protein
MTFVTQPGPNRNLLADGELRVRDRYSAIYTYNEPAIAQKCFPLVWGVGKHLKDSNGDILEEPSKFSIITSVGNKKIKFANIETDELHKIKEVDNNFEYDQILNMYLDGGLNSPDSPITYWEFVQYRETVFPHMKNQFQNENLERPNFVSFYRHNRPDRTKTFETSSFGYYGTTTGDLSQSAWTLDEHEEFLSRSYSTLARAHEWGSSTVDVGATNIARRSSANRAGEGLLMTTLTQFWDGLASEGNRLNGSSTQMNQAKEALDNRMSPGPLYMRRTSLLNTASVSNPSGMIIPQTGGLSNNKIFQGGALWEAGSTREVKDANGNYISAPKEPFYDSYEDYIEEARRKYKNFSVLPEFRMSTQIEDYLSNDVAIELDMFEVTGGTENAQNSSQSQFYEIYSNSDFMRQFELINEDHKEFTNGKVLSLRCKAVKKFLPYEGFYPAQRTADLAQRFYDSFKEHISLFNTNGVQLPNFNFGRQMVMTPLFAPGVLFNTIKSGVAVDYPIMTGSLDAVSVTVGGESEFFIKNQNFDARIPFEALVEPKDHLSSITLVSNEPHPSGNLSSSAIWDGEGDQLYSLMANNFLAEVPEFFLPNGNFSSIVSKPQGEGIILESGKVYGMRVFMRKTYDNPRVAVYHSGSSSMAYLPPQDIIRTGSDAFRENFTMYSRPSAFGPPTRGITDYDAGGDMFMFDQERFILHGNLNGGSHEAQSSNGYNYPFTPPYYHGEAWCDIWITGSGETLTIKKLQSLTTASFTRHDSSFTTTGGGAIGTSNFGPQAFPNINNNAVQLTASLNMFFTGKTTTKNSAAAGGNLIVDTALDQDARWVIQTKFETPMLNFNHISEANNNLSIPVYGSESVPRGMWHQYGRIPSNDEGVFMGVKPIDANWQAKVMGRDGSTPAKAQMENLADILGFSGVATKLGRIRSNKKIFEAVVAVPFFEEDGKRKFFLLDEQKVRLYLEGPNPSNAEAHASLTSGDPKTQIGRTVLNQIEKMRKYIFPPSFDFITNEEVDPIAMYVFEFSHTLNQQDLSDIWQNLPPDIGTTMEQSEVAITHPLLQKELLGKATANGNATTEIPNRLRWMVFKVKQRAASNYYKKTVKRNPILNSTVENSNAEVDEFGLTSKIQYNWPYDFFSLVELVKIDAEVEFGNFDSNSLANYVDSIPEWNGVNADDDKIEIAASLFDEGIVATPPGPLPAPDENQTLPGAQTPGGPQTGIEQTLPGAQTPTGRTGRIDVNFDDEADAAVAGFGGPETNPGGSFESQDSGDTSGGGNDQFGQNSSDSQGGFDPDSGY